MRKGIVPDGFARTIRSIDARNVRSDVVNQCTHGLDHEIVVILSALEETWIRPGLSVPKPSALSDRRLGSNPL